MPQGAHEWLMAARTTSVIAQRLVIVLSCDRNLATVPTISLKRRVRGLPPMRACEALRDGMNSKRSLHKSPELRD
jgi:hypothetical protein